MKKIVTILSVILLMAGTAVADGKNTNKEKKSKESYTLLNTNTAASSAPEDTGGGDGGSDPKPPGVDSDALSTNLDTSSEQSWIEWLISLIFG